MNQPKPAHVIQTSDSEADCPIRAGSQSASRADATKLEEQFRALLGDERAQDANYYLGHFSRSQRKELAAAALKTLDGEVVMLRIAMKRFFDAVRADESPETIEKLGEALNLLGLSCSRLGNVLKINQALQGAAQNAGQSALMEKLMEELALITPEVKEQDEA